MASQHSQSDMSVLDDYYDVSWAGYYHCEDAYSSSECGHGHARLNLKKVSTTSYGKHVMCQELGHSLGLKHRDSDSCMKTGSSYKYYNSHDVAHVDGRYN